MSFSSVSTRIPIKIRTALTPSHPDHLPEEYSPYALINYSRRSLSSSRREFHRSISFGAGPPAAKIEIPWLLKPPHWLFNKVLNTRTKEMLAEDLLGFGVMRMTIDLYRQRIMNGRHTPQTATGLPGQKQKTKNSDLNFPAAFERILRESASIFTDNILGGVVAFSIALIANQWGAKGYNLSDKFVSDHTVHLFRDLLGEMAAKNRISSDPKLFQKNFLSLLAQKINVPHESVEQTYESWSRYQQAIARKQPKYEKHRLKTLYQQDLTELAQHKYNHTAERYDVTLPLSTKTPDSPRQQGFALGELIEDAKHFMDKIALSEKGLLEKGSYAIGKESTDRLLLAAKKILHNTEKMNNAQFAGVGIALGMTFLTPFAIQSLTRKIFHFANYPGDIGLRRMVSVNEIKDKPWYEQHFPFLTDCVRKKNPIALITLLPLMVSLGMFDMQELSAFRFKAAFNNPLKPIRYLNRLKEMYRFGKGFPFTTQQQMATGFAFVITSRLMTARSDNEFRERTVDCFLGWLTWILATPMLKRVLSKSLQEKIAGVRLLNSKNNLRTEEEILHFTQRGENKKKTFTAFSLIKYSSTLFTILTLGLLEPLMAIKWTGYLGKKEREKTVKPDR